MPDPGALPPVDGRGLLALSRVVTGTLDLQEVLDESFAALRRLIAFDGGAIQLVEDGHLVAAATDPPATPEALAVRIPVGTGISGTIALTGEPIYIPDITVDERVHPEGRKRGLSGGVRTYFGAPLIVQGTPVGVVQIDSHDVDAFDADARETLLAFLPTITAAVQNARLFAREQAARDRLEELDQRQRDFMAMISHELRTPVVAIAGYARLLGDDRFAQLIDVAVGDLSRLIDDLLAVAGAGGGSPDRAAGPVALADLVAEALVDLRQPTGRVAVDVGPAVAVAVADRALLRRVVVALVDNALKFSGGPVEVRATPGDDGVALAVADQGPGMPPEDQERVFERFVQLDPGATRRHGGMGIGLFLARDACARLDVPLRLASTPGEGTTVTVTLPAGEVGSG